MCVQGEQLYTRQSTPDFIKLPTPWLYQPNTYTQQPPGNSRQEAYSTAMMSSVRPSKTHYDSSSSTTSFGSYSSSDSDVSAISVRASMDRPVASIEIIRCFRCARSVEMTTTDEASMYGMIRVGTGIYYCDRCARMTGYPK
ncbi:hypothetical protein VM1G_07277 [Cytospora mali]|uniref:Uncharacterized protein n=1 Tax=Cytospora mali TaxID=578113 RepID=A0A194W5C5_CYTMA|nr:hypothetical protein VM1G_07277 [Valsa mali]